MHILSISYSKVLVLFASFALIGMSLMARSFDIEPQPASAPDLHVWAGEDKFEIPQGHVFELREELPVQTSIAIRLLDALGQVQAEREIVLERGASKVFLSLEPLSQGIYFVEIQTAWEQQSEMVIVE